MADAGSQQILDLLNADSVRLTKSGKRLATALRRAPERKRGVPAPIAFAALDDIRRFYARLSGQIASVQTVSPAKADVLGALQVADQGFAALEDALQRGVNRKGAKLARRAKKLAKRAERDLKVARAGLG